MADEAILLEYFFDSESEAEFDGFDAEDIIDDIDLHQSKTFDMIYLDDDEENGRDLDLGWSRSATEKLIPPFTGKRGLNVHIDGTATPLEFFNLFVDNDVFETMAVETNRYHDQMREKRGILKPHARMNKWYETSASEMKQFFGLTLLTGLVERNAMSEFWTTDGMLETPIFGKTMSRDRFFNLLSFFHVVNNEIALPREDEGFDPIFKIRPIYDVLNRNFKKVYSPDEHVCIDEGMVPWKGHLSFRQYIPNKPDKFGVKLYILSESKSGYICSFDVYTGKWYVPDADDNSNENGHSYNVVMGLLKSANILNKGYTVYTDNYYTSPLLYLNLLAEDTLAVGTVRSNRKEMPIALKKKLKRGQEIYRQRGNLLAVKWTDKRDVYMLSSKHEPTLTITDKSDRVTGEPIVKPTVIVDYNKHMGGVDLSDQMNKYYSITRKVLKWWKKLLFHMMNMAVTNAYLIHKKQSDKPLSHYNFRVELARELIKSHVVRKPLRGRPSDRRENEARLSERHFPEKIPAKEGAKVSNPTRKCVVCNVNSGKRFRKGIDSARRIESRYWCPDCKVALCIDPCFCRYHTLVNYKPNSVGSGSDSE